MIYDLLSCSSRVCAWFRSVQWPRARALIGLRNQVKFLCYSESICLNVIYMSSICNLYAIYMSSIYHLFSIWRKKKSESAVIHRRALTTRTKPKTARDRAPPAGDGGAGAHGPAVEVLHQAERLHHPGGASESTPGIFVGRSATFFMVVCHGFSWWWWFKGYRIN